MYKIHGRFGFGIRFFSSVFISKMDVQDKIQLGEKRYIDAVNQDTTIKIPLESNGVLNIEYDIQNTLDITQIFDVERQASKKYRIHGEFEYLSILNGLPVEYTLLNHFFALIPLSADTKNIYSDLKIYLVKPSTDFTELIADERYIKNYEVIADLDNVDIFNSAYARNIYSEQQHTYVVDIDIDITDQYDGLDFPITELSLYVVYQPQENGDGDPETMERKTYDANGDTIIENFTPSATTINVGDIIQGDVINYEKLEYLQTDYIYNGEPQLMEHYIYTPYKSFIGVGKFATPTSGILKWKYKPFTPITLRYLDVNITRGNTGSTSYEVANSIPPFATKIDDDGNYVWRNILDNGFFDPLENIGVNFPFINQRHYVFSNIIFKMQPDLDHLNTDVVFDEILFAQNTLINAEPDSSLDNIGEICN